MVEETGGRYIESGKVLWLEKQERGETRYRELLKRLEAIHRERKGAAVGEEEGEDRIQGEGGGRGRCAVGLHGSLPTAAAAVSFVDRMDCIGSVQPLGGGDVDSEGKQKKKQRGFSKTCFRKKEVVGTVRCTRAEQITTYIVST